MRVRRERLLGIAGGLLVVLASACVQEPDLVSLKLDLSAVGRTEIDTLVEVVEQRLDALGVRGADVVRSGGSVEVRVRAEDAALVRSSIAPKPVALEFRPVLANLGLVPTGEDRDEAEARAAELRVALGVPAGLTAQQVIESEQAVGASAEAGGSIDDGQPLSGFGVDVSDERFSELFAIESQLATELTPLDALTPQEPVTLSSSDGAAYELGPVSLNAAAIEGAIARRVFGEWRIELVLREGASGIGLFNEIAAACSAGEPRCPATPGSSGQLAVVVDGRVLSAPSIADASFERDQIQISGEFTEAEAKSLANALRFGSSPVVVRFED